MPDELLLEVFEYVSSCDLICGLYNLNQRLNSIIHGIRLYLDLSHVQQKIFRYTCQRIIPRFRQQVASIKLSNKYTIDGIGYYLEQSTVFHQEHLQELVLVEPTIEQLIQLIAYFPSLSNLRIRTSDYLNIPIEHLPQTLRVCRLSNCQIDLRSADLTDRVYAIEELQVKLSDTTDLFMLLDAMIYLKRFTCHLSENSPTNPSSLGQQKPLLFLQYLKLNICSASFRYMEHLFDRCPNLTALTYTYTAGLSSTHDHEHIDPERWNCLFTMKLVHLNTLDLHISLTIDEERDIVHVAKLFQDLPFCLQNHIRLIYEITSYKHILCTIPLAKSHLNNHNQNASLINIPNAYSRIRHLDLILNETMLNQQQHTLRCPLVHSFYLGLYEKMTPIEQQSRLLLNQSISFVYLKHFELYGTCISDGFVAQLLSRMTNLNSLTLPLTHLGSCQANQTIRRNMQRIQKLQLALTESISMDCVQTILIPVFPNLHSLIFAIDNKIQSIDQILCTLLNRVDDSCDAMKGLMFLEVFALDQDWTSSMLTELSKSVRYKQNHRILHAWL